MIKINHFLSILCLLLPISALAQNPGWIPSTFEDDPLLQLGTSLSPNCADTAKTIFTNLEAYAKAASSEGQARFAGGLGDSILKQVRDLQGSDCEEEALTAYTFGSYFISQQDLVHRSRYWKTNTVSDELKSFRKIAILALLMQKQKIHYLTELERNTLKGEWVNPSVFGGYECVQSDVFIDPLHHPFDLGSIVEHELDHLMRDKYLSEATLNTEFKVGEEIDWEMYLTLDETLAGLAAANLQRFQVPDLYTHARVRDTRDFFMRKKKWPYSIPGRYEADHDFNFRNPHGPAEALFQTGLFEDQALTLTDADAMAQKKILKKYRPILRLIHDGYFQTRDDFKIGQSLLLKPHSKEFLALNANQVFSTSVHGFLAPVSMELDDLSKKLDHPSPTCSLFQDAAKKGKVGSYLGLKFQIKLGETGSRPGETGSRPGETGSRPGETGSRPGETGSRPATSVKPCLFINQLQ